MPKLQNTELVQDKAALQRLASFARARKKELGVELEDMSRESGLTISQLENILSGSYSEKLKPAHLRKLAKVLQVSQTDLEVKMEGLPIDIPAPIKKTALGEFVAKRRSEFGWNQLELANQTQLSAGTIASIESGYSQAPKAKTLQMLAKGLKVSYAELDCIIRGVPYDASIWEGCTDREPLRDFEHYLLQESAVPKEVAETVIEMVKTVIQKYEN